MYRVRVISPAPLTGALLDTLTAESGVHSMVVLPGAARRPDGTPSTSSCDGAANATFHALRELGLDSQGMISVERVDAALTSAAHPAAPAGALQRERAPVWEMVESVIRGGASYAPSFYILLAIAGLIGAVGILTNSQILIVGAMVVGPEYNAIIAVALGITRRDRGAVRDGLLALTWGFFAATVVTLLFSLAIRARPGAHGVPGRRPAGR